MLRAEWQRSSRAASNRAFVSQRTRCPSRRCTSAWAPRIALASSPRRATRLAKYVYYAHCLVSSCNAHLLASFACANAWAVRASILSITCLTSGGAALSSSLSILAGLVSFVWRAASHHLVRFAVPHCARSGWRRNHHRCGHQRWRHSPGRSLRPRAPLFSFYSVLRKAILSTSFACFTHGRT